jgi:DNA-binding XRE family transcriptional regulator
MHRIPKITALPPGRQLRQWRTLDGRTQADCARLLGISPAQLSRIERGEVAMPQSAAARLAVLQSKGTPRMHPADENPAYVCQALPPALLSALDISAF